MAKMMQWFYTDRLVLFWGCMLMDVYALMQHVVYIIYM